MESHHLACLVNGCPGWRKTRRLRLRCGRLGYVIDSLIVNLKQLINLPVREHAFEYAAVVGIRESDYVSGKPPVELCPARPAFPQGWINSGCDPVVFATESAVSLQVASLEQHLQHDRLCGQCAGPFFA